MSVKPGSSTCPEMRDVTAPRSFHAPRFGFGACSLIELANRALMSSSLSVADQMQILRSGDDVATFALQHLGLPSDWRDTNEPGNTERCQDAVNRVFTLTRADIETCLATQGLEPEKLPPVRTTKDSHDGTYFIARRPGEWEYYYQERGFPWAGVTFDDLGEARKFLLNDFIPIWLEHLRVPCRTKDGRMMTSL